MLFYYEVISTSFEVGFMQKVPYHPELIKPALTMGQVYLDYDPNNPEDMDQ